MSATDTAQRVIEWAMGMSPEIPPPQGDIHAAEQLAHPPPGLACALARLTVMAAARLRLGTSPFGDSEALGVGTLIIAAAIGCSNLVQIARRLLGVVPATSSPIEWVARHGLVSPALSHVKDGIADDLREISPLSALLLHPGKGREAVALQVAQRFLEHRDGRRSLTLHLARPVGDVDIRLWRLDLLERFRISHQEFVIDVYEATMVYHREQALHQIKAANTILFRGKATDDMLRDALSIADWWRPLWAIRRADVDALRKRPYLDYEYRKGIDLYISARRQRGG